MNIERILNSSSENNSNNNKNNSDNNTNNNNSNNNTNNNNSDNNTNNNNNNPGNSTNNDDTGYDTDDITGRETLSNMLGHYRDGYLGRSIQHAVNGHDSKLKSYTKDNNWGNEYDLKEAQYLLNAHNKQHEQDVRIEVQYSDAHKRALYEAKDINTGSVIYEKTPTVPSYIQSAEEMENYKNSFHPVLGTAESVRNDTTNYNPENTPFAKDLPAPVAYDETLAVEGASPSENDYSSPEEREPSSLDLDSSDDSSDNGDDNNVAPITVSASSGVGGTKRKREEDDSFNPQDHKIVKKGENDDDDEPKGTGLGGSGSFGTGSGSVGGAGSAGGGQSSFKVSLDYFYVMLLTFLDGIADAINCLFL
jgi:hypothetical protein